MYGTLEQVFSVFTILLIISIDLNLFKKKGKIKMHIQKKLFTLEEDIKYIECIATGERQAQKRQSTYVHQKNASIICR